MSLVVRTRGEPALAIPEIVRIAHEIDPDLPLFGGQTLEQSLAKSVDLQRALSSLLSVFGLLGVCLAALGIYGVMAHAVTLRTKEIGIRMALGARASEVLRMVVTEGLQLTSVGVLLGLLISAIASGLLSTFVFGLHAMDAMTFAVSGVVLCAVAVAASFVPARRAASVDPLLALRHD
jgi:putative ABC transport system permease protein